MERSEKPPRLRQVVRTILSAILRRAVKDDYLARNPCDAVDTVTLPKVEKASLTPEQVSDLLEAAKGNRLEALYHIALMASATGRDICP